VQVGAAEAGERHPHLHLPGARRGRFDLCSFDYSVACVASYLHHRLLKD
jgi:hypothetical protein